MFTKLIQTIMVFAVSFFTFTPVGQAQLFKNTMAGNVSPDSDVQVTTSVMLSLDGIDRHTSIHQMDSNGIKYDLFSRLQNKEIREASGIPIEIQTEILLMHEKLSNQIHNDTLDAILDEATVKERFREIHASACDMITDEDMERIQIAAAKIDIGKIGLSKFIESPANTLGLQVGEAQIKQLHDCRKTFEAMLQNQAKDLCRTYNQRWLDSLNAEHRKKLGAFEKSPSFDRWLESKLLIGSKRKQPSTLRRPSDLARKICYSNSACKRHRITTEQRDAIASQRKLQIEKPLAERARLTNAEVQEILDKEQFASLSIENWCSNAERLGTLDEFINGDPANFLQLTDSERKALFVESQQLAESYQEELKELRKAVEEKLLDAISQISERDGERLVQILGLNLINSRRNTSSLF